MAASFLKPPYLSDISSAAAVNLENQLFKMHLVASGIWHFADDRQPHRVSAKVARATAEVRICLAKIVAGADEYKSTLKRERQCAADFIPSCEAV